MKRGLQVIIVAVSLVLFCSGTGFSMSDAELMKKFAEMEKILQKQQKQIENQNQIIEKLQGKVAAVPDSDTVVPANREQIKNIVAELVGETMPVPGWLKGFKYSGDFRLRYEGIYNRKDADDRHRGRFRLRINFAKKLCDELDVVFRLASASGPAITSTNQSFDDAFSEKGFWIDRAFALYRPKWLKGLELGGGKLKNPFVHTDILWDSDVNPEGVYEKYVFNMACSFKPFITLAQLFIYENNTSRDASLLVYQAGYNWDIADSQWVFAATLYDFTNLEDSQLVEDGNARGNSVMTRSGADRLECGFKIVNVTSFWKTRLFGKPFKLYGDFARNISSDCDDNDKAYALGFSIGSIKKKGDWSFGYKYARIEPDAVVGVFADANFGHANRQGNKFSLKYKFHPKIVFGATAWITDSVRGSEDDITDLALDMIFKF